VLSIHFSNCLRTPNGFSSVLQFGLSTPYLHESQLFRVLDRTHLFALQLLVSSF